MSGIHDDIVESLTYMRDVFMPEQDFKSLLINGSSGFEEFTMRGDDLAGFVHHFYNVLSHFEVE